MAHPFMMLFPVSELRNLCLAKKSHSYPDALARLGDVNAQISAAVVATAAVAATAQAVGPQATASAAVLGRDVAAEPATVAYVPCQLKFMDLIKFYNRSDVLKIVSDGTTMGSDIAKLIADLKSNPQAASQPDAATVTYVAIRYHKLA